MNNYFLLHSHNLLFWHGTPDELVRFNGPTIEYDLAFTGTIEADGDDLSICEFLFELHNRDDRPRGREIRSLSVGDVVILKTGAYFCDAVGWQPIRAIPGLITDFTISEPWRLTIDTRILTTAIEEEA